MDRAATPTTACSTSRGPAAAPRRRASRCRAVASRATPAPAPAPAQSAARRRLARPTAAAAPPAAAAATTTTASTTTTTTTRAPPPAPGTTRIVILGGTGRVGAATAAALLAGNGGGREGAPPPPPLKLDLLLVGRDAGRGAAAVEGLAPAAGGTPIAVATSPDALASPAALAPLLEGAALLIHCAGPFQAGGGGGCGGGVPAPLAAAIAAGIPYVDVCDDPDWAQAALAAAPAAAAAGVPAVTTAGVFPGISNLMAAAMVDAARTGGAASLRQQGGGGGAPQGGGGAAPPPSTAADPVEPARVRYSYYVAGSGGAGPAVLEASLLLAARPAVAYVSGAVVTRPAMTDPRPVDFGPPLGEKTVSLLSLPEVESTSRCLRVPAVSARFATAPAIFNWATAALVAAAPRWVGSRDGARAAARLAAPFVAAADGVVGSTLAMRVDVELVDGTAAAGLYIHRRATDAVGQCTAAFARALLDPSTPIPPGVWSPEALPAPARTAILRDAGAGTGEAPGRPRRFELGRADWEIATEPTRLGFGIYI